MEEGRLVDVFLHCQRAGSKDNVKDGNGAGLRRTAYADRKEMYKSFCAFFWRIFILFKAVHAHTPSSVAPVRNY